MTTHAVIDLAKALIACPSITPDDAGCQTLIQERLAKIGFQCESMPFNQTSNLWARYGQEPPLFVFAGHTDVVPPGNLKDWASPPFLPEERVDHLYGRGASDMKGALAAMVIATENIINKHKTLAGSIAFLITSDEEGPARDGTQKVIAALKARGEKIDYCMIGEPCCNERVGDEISIGRRGSLHGKLTIKGTQGHIARPHLAANAIHLSLLPLHELTQIIWDHGDTHFPPTSFQISNIQSGTGALNVIPGELTCHFNFRYAETNTPAQLQAHLENLLHRHGLTFEIDWSTSALPFLTHQGKLLTATQEAITSLTGQTPTLSTGGGTSDGRFIAPTGAEVIELGASRKTAHHTNECVRMEDLITLTALYEDIVRRLIAKDI